MTLSVALVGLGEISRYFAAACRRDASVTLGAVCDPDPARRLPYERAGVPGVRSVEELLERRDLDAAIVCAPNDVHRELCTAALAGGLHVCCEKPLAPALADACAIAQAARAHGRVLFTAFHRNFNEHFLTLAALAPAAIRHVRVRYCEDIREHAAGESWYLDPRRCGGGCIADNGPNAFAMLRELVGPLTVRGVQASGPRGGAETSASIALRGDGEVTATVELDWRFAHGELKDVAVQLRDGSVRRADLLAGHQVFKSSLFHEYGGILAEFRRALAGESARGEHGVEIAGLIEAAYAAAQGAPAGR
jgi:predicted dehydrogenase